MIFYKKGFTLIELLVSIAIISLLVATTITMLSTAQKKAKDSRRLGDMKTIQKALEMYYNDHNTYLEESTQGNWEKSYEDNGAFMEKLTNLNYVSGKTPTDPVNSSNKYYAYYFFPKGAYGCNKSAYYVLGIYDMESVEGVHPQSPGWSCPGRDFQDDFEWVTGAYIY